MVVELCIGVGVNILIDSVNSDVDIGLRRTSDLVVGVGDTGSAELGTNEDVKIGMKIELESGGKELGENILMDRDNSDVGKGIRTFVVLIGVLLGTIVATISEDTVKSITGDVVKGSGLSISEEPIENKKVCVGDASVELSTDGEARTVDVSTSIVEAMLKDSCDIEGVGVIIIITAVVSSMGGSIALLLILGDKRSTGLLLVIVLVDGLCVGLLLTRMKGRLVGLLLTVRKGI